MDQKRNGRVSGIMAIFMITLAMFFDVLKFLLDFIYLGMIAETVAYLIFITWFFFLGVNTFAPKNHATTAVSFLLGFIPWLPPITFFVGRQIGKAKIEDKAPALAGKASQKPGQEGKLASLSGATASRPVSSAPRSALQTLGGQVAARSETRSLSATGSTAGNKAPAPQNFGPKPIINRDSEAFRGKIGSNGLNLKDQPARPPARILDLNSETGKEPSAPQNNIASSQTLLGVMTRRASNASSRNASTDSRQSLEKAA